MYCSSRKARGIGLGSVDQAVDRRSGVSAARGVAEQPVFTPHHERADSVLCRIVVQRDQAIVDEPGQAEPLVIQVVQGFTQRTFGQYLGQ